MCLLCQRDGKTERHHGSQPKPKPVFRPRTRCSAELAWAAGFFDGEGYTTTSGRYLQVGITQKDTRTLDRFLAAVGLGSVTHPVRISCWRANGADAYRVMEKLWPALSAPKREQFLRIEGQTT